MNYSLYYNWQKTVSYDAFINLIIGGRSIGKTYGIRYQCFTDFIKYGYHFAEVCRYESEITAVGNNYFAKLQQKGDLSYKGKRYLYRFNNRCIELAEEPTGNKKPKWEKAGYIVSLTAMQKTKKMTFENVRKIIFDEAIIDKELSPHSRYLKNEYEILMNVVSTLLREEPGEKTKGRIYLLGNAVDINNPYFSNLGVEYVPDPGFYWRMNKLVLIHIVDDPNKDLRKESSLIYKVLQNTDESKSMFGEGFKHDSTEFIEKKPWNAVYWIGIRYVGNDFAIWFTFTEPYYTYVTTKLPKDPKPFFALTMHDNTPDKAMIQKSHGYMNQLKNWYMKGNLRFENSITREKFLEVLKFLGLT